MLRIIANSRQQGSRGTAEGWLKLQSNYDLAQVMLREKSITVQPIAW